MTRRRASTTGPAAHAEPTTTASRIVNCPQCGGDSVYAASNPYRPFCSQRCKNIDFGAWADESFRVPDDNSDPDATPRDSGNPLQ